MRVEECSVSADRCGPFLVWDPLCQAYHVGCSLYVNELGWLGSREL